MWPRLLTGFLALAFTGLLVPNIATADESGVRAVKVYAYCLTDGPGLDAIVDALNDVSREQYAAVMTDPDVDCSDTRISGDTPVMAIVTGYLSTKRLNMAGPACRAVVAFESPSGMTGFTWVGMPCDREASNVPWRHPPGGKA